MQEPLFLQPAFQERIWGSNRLHTLFSFGLSDDKVGEDWAIGTHPHDVNTVLNGELEGKKLDELQADHQELFGHADSAAFPLLTKILNAEDDLSAQVHPDDAYGQECEGELGKTECWYIIDAKPGTEIIYGYHTKTKGELTEMTEEGRWDDLLRKVPVKKGDSYYVPGDTIHAIGSGVLILETQQSSDTIYRVYGCNRTDNQGKTRELHIQQSIDVATVPAKDPDLSIQQESQEQSSIVTYVKTDFFDVYEWRVSGILKVRKQTPYTLVTAIGGVGRLITKDAAKADVATFDLRKGGSFIFPTNIPGWRFEGDLAVIASEPGSR